MNGIEYASALRLLDPWIRPSPFQTEEESDFAVDAVLRHLIHERWADQPVPSDRTGRARLLRGLLNLRPPGPLPGMVQDLLDRLLWTARLRAGVVPVDRIPAIHEGSRSAAPHEDQLALWQGDITRLSVDAVVNAANKALLGCFQPLHTCIDNAIHSAAGPGLREECQALMTLQGRAEDSGRAKITRAYHLPSRFVLHTVGPIVRGELTEQHRRTLRSCYQACLDLAARTQAIETIAFCCISTGVFGFPGDEAAAIAVGAVRAWLDEHPGPIRKVLFDVFSQDDHERYR